MIDTEDWLTSDFGSLPDREEIKELTALYCWHVVRADARAVSRLFIADGIFDAPFLGDSGRNVSRGRDAIERRLNDSLRPGRMCPFIANHIIRVCGDDARGSCVMRNSIGNSDGNRSEFIGYYRDRYRKEPEGWRFAERVWRLYVPTFDVDSEPPI